MLKPNDSYNATFTTQGSTGAATNADSTPTATVRKNGTTDGAVTPTVTGLSTGLYKISFTVPSGYIAGDMVQVEVSATVGGVAGKCVADSFVIDTARMGEVHARIGSNGAGLTALGDTRLANLDATISSRNATTPPTAVQNAGAVRTELATELGRVDASISSRSTYAGGAVASVTGSVGSVTAPVTVGTNSDKTGYSLQAAPPTASDIATAVWAASTRTLSGFGTLAADVAGAVWAASTRTLSAFGFTVNTLANATETAIKAKTDALPATFSDATLAKQNAILAALGSVEGGSGSGARSVVFTLTDAGDSPLETAKVRLSRNAESLILSTNEAGQATFNIDDGTWNYVATLAGYTPTSGQLIVADDMNVALELTARAIPQPANPENVVIYGYTTDFNQLAAPDVTVTLTYKTTKIAVGTNFPVDFDTTTTSDETGYWAIECPPSSAIFPLEPNKATHTLTVGGVSYGLRVADAGGNAAGMIRN